jgi:hypothetical protein
MFNHPYITGELARQRQRDMLAQADRQRLGRQLLALARTSRRAEATERRLHGALRIALRLRTEARMTARLPAPAANS